MRSTVVAATLAMSVGFGCVLVEAPFDRRVAVESGTYVPTHGTGVASRAAARAIRGLTIDRDDRTLTLALDDGSQIAASFVPRPREEWPSGCPANLGSTRMEVLEIDKDLLTIGSMTVTDPILVADCPPTPMEVTIRQDGEIGGGGSACMGTNECIVFAQR